MKCPVCRESKLIMSERQSIEIDYCPDCRGVWLDHGELDKIIERSNRDTERSHKDYKRSKYDTKHHIEGYEMNGRPYRKKKKSFFSELFDF